MKITAIHITNGLACNKIAHEVEGFGSFQTTYYQPLVGCTTTVYIAYSYKKHKAQLCDNLYEVAKWLECDPNELCENLPPTWTKEHTTFV